MKLIDPGFAEQVGDLAQAVGRADFAELLLAFLGSLVANDMTTMTRYSRFSKPDYVFYSESYTEDLAERYLSSYYRFDPFYRYWRTTERPGVVWLGALSSEELKRGRYMREFLAQSGISDEIGVFLPPLGRASVALFLERIKGRFTARERRLLEESYPLLAGLYKAHVSALFGTTAEAPEASEAPKADAALPARRPVLVTDASGARVFENAAWQALEAARPQEVAGALAALAASDGRQVALASGPILHREALDEAFRLAPSGRIWTLEQPAEAPQEAPSGPDGVPFEDQLTPREREIVALVLAGHPTLTIARRLGLSRGTVKNHRRRIYYKLDITSERELFLLHIEALSKGSNGA